MYELNEMIDNFVKNTQCCFEVSKRKRKMGDMDPDSVSLEFGIDIQAAVAERLAQKNKKTVQLNDLLKDTKFTKSEIRTMYRGFKQVSLLRLFNLHISFSLLTRMYTTYYAIAA